MPVKPSQTQEINNFVQGLVTEASVLNFPPNASVDENNFTLDRDGSRKRRLGLGIEAGGTLNTTSIVAGNIKTTATAVYKWENVKGIAGEDVAVVQMGNVLSFHPLYAGSPSAEKAYADYTFPTDVGTKLDFASVDGKLVIPTMDGKVTVLSPQDDGTLEEEVGRLKIRDLTGVEDTYQSTDPENPNTPFNGEDLLETEYLSVRPYLTPGILGWGEGLSNTHLYNLRNQTWATPVKKADSRDPVRDPLSIYADLDARYPSNADNLNTGMQTDSTDSKLPVRLSAQSIREAITGNTRAPVGHFVIDALNRGASRKEQLSLLYDKNPELSVVADYANPEKEDRTPGGATLVSEYAGHVFYAGFSGSTIDPDSHSLELSNVIMYSQLVKGSKDIFSCYQEGDPTSEESFDLVATDGGYLRISEAYGIARLIPLGTALIVLAANGVWSVAGGSDYGFDATNHLVTKLSSRGVVSSSSVVVLDEQVAYWSEDGIYSIVADAVGGYKAQNLTAATVQSFYNNISSADKATASGGYDNYTRKVSWVYGDNLELTLDVELGAFTPSSYPEASLCNRTLIGYVETPPYVAGTSSEPVTVGLDAVTVGGEEVTVDKTIREVGPRGLKYLFYDTEGSTAKYGFASRRNQSFEDWADLGGYDALAYLLTGAVTGGDAGKMKQAPYLTMHLAATETGFDADYNLVNEGSCLVRSQWNWTNSISGNKWGKPFQAYRKKRVYFPDDDLILDDGEAVVTTKNKLRGRGRAVSIYMESEPRKDLQLLGWSLDINGNTVT